MRFWASIFGFFIGGGLTGMLYVSLEGSTTPLPLASQAGIAAALVLPVFIGACIDGFRWYAREMNALWDRFLEEYEENARFREEMRNRRDHPNHLDNPHLRR